MSPQQSHWHHYIAQMQQRPFAADSERRRIWLFDKETGGYELATLRDTAARMDYYTVRTDAETHDKLERTFSRVESEAARIIPRLRSIRTGHLQLSEDERAWLAILVAISRARVPAQREGGERIAEMLARMALGNAVADREHFADRARAAGIAGSDEELEALRQRIQDGLAEGSMQIAVDPAASLPTMVAELMSVPALLAPRRFLILRTEEPRLILSDNPVVLAGRSHAAPVGYTTEGVRVTLPLAPEVALSIVDERGDHEATAINASGVVALNRSIWAQAVRYVFAPSREQLEGLREELGEEAARRRGGGIVLGGWLPGEPLADRE